MSFLLDTNVVSEWARPSPDPGVVRWLADMDEDRAFLSVVTLAELRHGVDRLADGARRTRLDSWLAQDLVSRFEGRILPVDQSIADLWGRLVARREAAGRPISSMDAFLAATAERHALTLVTRNTDDFDSLGLSLENPWVRHE